MSKKKLGSLNKSQAAFQIAKLLKDGNDSEIEFIDKKSLRIFKISLTIEDRTYRVDDDGTKWVRVV